MKKRTSSVGWLLLLVVMANSMAIGIAQQTAAIRLICGSLKMEVGTSSNLATVAFTQIAPEINGELRPVSDFEIPRLSHEATFYMTNGFGVAGLVQGMVRLPALPGDDADTNNVPDFFEPERGALVTNLVGEFESSLGSGQVIGVFERASGNSVGSWSLEFTLPHSDQSEVFAGAFSLVGYAGELVYAPTQSGVPATAAMARWGEPTNVWQADLFFERVVDHLYETKLWAGGWTNSSGQVIPYPELLLTRALLSGIDFSPTVFRTGFIMADGEPHTVAPDFPNWMIAVDDRNDSDGDGIPDLVDVFGAHPPHPPVLSVEPADGGIIFRMEGELGRWHELQEATSLAAPDWQTIGAGNFQTNIAYHWIPAPTNAATFWRMLAR